MVEEIVEPKKNISNIGLWITIGILLTTVLTLIILYFSGALGFFSFDPMIKIPEISDLTKEEALQKLIEAGYQESDITFNEE